MTVDLESTHQNTSRMMYLIIILYLLNKVQKMTLWMSQSASISHPSLKMTVDLESTHQNTSRMI